MDHSVKTVKMVSSQTQLGDIVCQDQDLCVMVIRSSHLVDLHARTVPQAQHLMHLEINALGQKKFVDLIKFLQKKMENAFQDQKLNAQMIKFNQLMDTHAEIVQLVMVHLSTRRNVYKDLHQNADPIKLEIEEETVLHADLDINQILLKDDV